MTWTFRSDVVDRADDIEFTWDIGHTVRATRPDGQLLREWLVGAPEKATTSRRTVENSIRTFLDTRQRVS